MEDLSLRQQTVKQLIQTYRPALELSEAKDETSSRLESFREKLASQGLPLYGEEVLACIALLEDFMDLAENATVEEVQIAIALMLLGLNQELQDRWASKDVNFFTA